MSASLHILVVDDEPAICWGFQQLLGDQGHTVVTAASAEEGLQKASLYDYSLILLDVRLPGEDGISALPKFREATQEAPIVVMTAFGDLETAVGAVQNGATDYLTKPFRLDDAAKICQQAMRQRRGEPNDDSSTAAQADNDAGGETNASVLVGQSPAMQQVFRQIALVADSDLPVLITGESGTGKELVAAAIHRHSRRSDQAYLSIAPGAVNEEVLQSELFGHIQGGFTGAGVDRPGLFALADGGTLMLDEIGDLPLPLQVKLLRVLERGELTPLGDNKPRKCDVRCVAVTSRDLQQAADAGSFRDDLLYRLTAVSIELPPLRSRVEDIVPLCEFFLRRLGHPSAADAIAADAIDYLQSQPWWGNVRELRHAVERASVVARGRRITPGDLPPPQSSPQNASHFDEASNRDSPGEVVKAWTQTQLDHATGEATDLHEKFLAAVEPALLAVVLKHTNGNRAAAAELLGIHRGTLRERLKRYGIEG